MAEINEIFGIDPEVEEALHPHALKVFCDWKADLLRKVPQLSRLSVEEVYKDINAHLKDEKKNELKSNLAVILDGLKECMPGSDLLAQIYDCKTLFPMPKATSLLMEVYERKAEEAREEQRKREEEAKAAQLKQENERKRREEQAEAERRKKEAEERWWVAYEKLNIPADDAIEYLETEEQEEFADSILGAVDAYLEKGEEYALDSRSFWYNIWLKRIKNRREEAEDKMAAAEQCLCYNEALCKAFDELKPKLHADKQNAGKYFNKDNHFPGQKLNSCLPPSQREELIKEIEHIAGGELKSLVPEDYLAFISWENRYYYRLRPIAAYVSAGVPCLAFSFEVDAVVESGIQLIPGKKSFRGYRFPLPVIDYDDDSTVLREPRFLGYFYQYLSPIQLPSVVWQMIPVSLLKGLMEGKLVPQGAKVIDESKAEIIYYEVKKFDELVNIPASFRAWLREMQGFEGMAKAGVISNQTAQIIIEQSPELKPAPIQGTTANEQPPGFTKEQFIKKAMWLGYPKDHAESLYQKAPLDLTLDDAVRSALQEYRKIKGETGSIE